MNNEEQKDKKKDVQRITIKVPASFKKDNSVDEEELTELIREILCTEFGICSVEQKLEQLAKPKHYTGIIGSNHLEEITEEEFMRKDKSKQSS